MRKAPAPPPRRRHRGPAVAVLSAVAGVVGPERLPAGLRPPGAIELPGARRRRARAERRTLALGVVALGTTTAVLGTELARVWRRGSAPLPTETSDVLG